MSLKFLIRVIVVVTGLLLLAACQTAELIFYEHRLSKVFYQELHIDEPDLKPFITDGVLFVVDTKAATHKEYYVWLGFYSKK